MGVVAIQFGTGEGRHMHAGAAEHSHWGRWLAPCDIDSLVQMSAAAALFATCCPLGILSDTVASGCLHLP